MTPATLASLSIELVPLDQLHPDNANPRSIGEAELDALTRSLRVHGLVQPILARRADNVVIGGHQRLVAARRLGLREVPVTWLDVSTDEAHLLGLALNKISGTWDEQLLARLLAELREDPSVDISLSGFDDDEVAGLLRTLTTAERRERPETFDLDEALDEATRQPRSRPGDIWALGDHRVSCGDATMAEDLERLLGGQRPAMAFVDPPYNVALCDHGGQGRGTRRRRIANDDLDAASWLAFCRAWADLLVSSTDGAIYVCMSGKELPTVWRVLQEAGGHWSDTIIWDKRAFTLGRAPLQRQYEPIWFGWREGAKPYWCGDRDQGDVWTIDRPTDAPLGPVMKPLALMERAIANSSRPGDLVLDDFLGTGSTLIAAERTGRRCAGLELTPKFIDVALTRWERFTGEKAALVSRLDDDAPRAERSMTEPSLAVLDVVEA